jgi:hypothetical protein
MTAGMKADAAKGMLDPTTSRLINLPAVRAGLRLYPAASKRLSIRLCS